MKLNKIIIFSFLLLGLPYGSIGAMVSGGKKVATEANWRDFVGRDFILENWPKDTLIKISEKPPIQRVRIDSKEFRDWLESNGNVLSENESIAVSNFRPKIFLSGSKPFIRWLNDRVLPGVKAKPKESATLNALDNKLFEIESLLSNILTLGEWRKLKDDITSSKIYSFNYFDVPFVATHATQVLAAADTLKNEPDNPSNNALINRLTTSLFRKWQELILSQKQVLGSKEFRENNDSSKLSPEFKNLAKLMLALMVFWRVTIADYEDLKNQEPVSLDEAINALKQLDRDLSGLSTRLGG